MRWPQITRLPLTAATRSMHDLDGARIDHSLLLSSPSAVYGDSMPLLMCLADPITRRCNTCG